MDILATEGESAEQAMARAVLDPSLLAGVFLSDLNKQHREGGPGAHVAEIRKQAHAVTAGNLSRLEEMLTAQAHSLDALFYSLAKRSRANTAEGYTDAGETYMKLALRAQSQCRATAESIATIKNPMAGAYIRQANVAAGHQQVNNGTPSLAQPSRVANSENQPSKLLEAQDGERLDTPAAGTASGADTELETMGAVDRAEDR